MALSPAYQQYPEHTLEIDAARTRVRILVKNAAGNCVLAETTDGLTLREGRYPATVYVPRDDVRMDRLARSQHSTHCPFKGDATYFDFIGQEGSPTAAQEQEIPQVAWSYEDPFDQMAEIRDYVAFYADRVDIEILPD